MVTKRSHPDSNELRPGVPHIPKAEDIPSGYNPENPWASDMLERSDHAEILTRYIEGINQPYVLAINAGWGQGKSLFLRMWRDDLVNKKGRHCILFNAWESDFGDDPLVALMGTVTKYTQKQIKDQGKGPGTKLVQGLKAIRAIVDTCWQNKDRIAADVIAGSTGIDPKKALRTPAKDRIDAFMDQIEANANFRLRLEEVAKALAGKGFPLVIMVDELDRCRPDYAVLLLERIKHLFSVPGVVFILALEAEQLICTIHALYGLDKGTGARTYLRKFIDREYTLPKPSHEQFADYLCAQYNLVDLHGPAREEFDIEIHKLFSDVSKVFELSLRDMAQIAAQTAAIAWAYRKNWVDTSLALFLLILRLQASKSYNGIKIDSWDWNALAKSLMDEHQIRVNSLPLGVSSILKTMFSYLGKGKTSDKDWRRRQHTDIQQRRTSGNKQADIVYSQIVSRAVELVASSLSPADRHLAAVEFAARFNLTGTGDANLPSPSLEARGTNENSDPSSP